MADVLIEQSLLDRIVEKHSPELTEAQVTKYFDGITLADLTMDTMASTDLLSFSANFTSTSRMFKILEDTWTSSDLTELVDQSLVSVASREEWLANPNDGTIFVIAPTADTNGIVLCPTDGASAGWDDWASVIPFMNTITEGVDFTDVGTLDGLHTTVVSTDVDVIAGIVTDDSLKDLVKGIISIQGGICGGYVYFVEASVHTFQATDLGKLPIEAPEANALVTEDGNTLTTESGDTLVAE